MEEKKGKINFLKSQGPLVKFQQEYWQEVREAKERGKKICWMTTVAGHELPQAFDLVVVSPDVHAATCGAGKVGGRLCEVSETEGYPIDVCSYPRVDIGSALMGEETLSPVKPPPADIYFTVTNPCDTHAYWQQAIARHLKVPQIVIDQPYYHDQWTAEDYREALDYLTKQFEEATTFLEEFTGKRLDYDRLKEVATESYKTGELWKEAWELAKRVPAPLTGFDWLFFMFLMNPVRGRPETTKIMEMFVQELKERIAQNIPAMTDEKTRIFWDGIFCFFAVGEQISKLLSWGVNPILARYPCLWRDLYPKDPSNPMRSVAEVGLQPLGLWYGVRRKVEWLIEMVREYSLDGLLFQTTKTCVSFRNSIYNVLEETEKATGVPGVIVETDQVDERAYSSADFAAKLDAFLEIVEQRKGKR